MPTLSNEFYLQRTIINLNTTLGIGKMSERPIEPIQVNKSVVFTSDKTSEKMVRTGITNEESLYHAILYNANKEYGKGDTEKRIKMVLDLKNQCASANSEKSMFTELITEACNYLLNNEELSSENGRELRTKYFLSKKERELFELVFELITLSKIEYILVSEDELDAVITKILRVFELRFRKELDDETRQVYCTRKLKAFLNTCRELSKPKVDIGVIQNEIGKNILVINSKTRTLEEIPELKFSRTIFILRFSNNHYEAIGKILEDNYIKREFEETDRLVRQMTK
jgi:hypothetical protein